MSEDLLPHEQDKPELEQAGEPAGEEVAEATGEDAPEVAEPAGETADDAADSLPMPVEATESAAASPMPETLELFAEQDGDAAASGSDPKVEAAVRNVVEEAKAQRASESRSAGEQPAAQEATPSSARRGLSLGRGAWLAICAASLVVGLLLGRFVLGGGGASTVDLDGRTTVSASELDSAYASFTYRGKTDVVTVREAIEQIGRVEDFQTDDGSYTLPPAEQALIVARNKILAGEVEERGITVSDDEVAAYAEQVLGTSDYEGIAASYGMETSEVEELLVENCKIDVLREEIVGEGTSAMPEAPDEPEEGKESEATKAYADYIIALAGDEWDSEAGTWVSDSRFAFLDTVGFSADAATYDAAQSAFYLAYQIYTDEQASLQSAWTTFSNELMSQASIQLGTLLA